MATVVGGIGTTHAPSIAFAHDHGHSERPEWKPFFDAFVPVREWLKFARPDTLIVFYNDHLNRFPLHTYPTFAIGCDERMPVADEGRGPRPFPDLGGNSDLAWHLCRSLIEDEFDITMCQEMTIDHGILSVLPLMVEPPWPVRIVPVAINVILHPLPTARRCWRLGEAIGRAVARYPRDERVAVVGTGGLSHQLQGRDFGFINTEWDEAFLDAIETDPLPLTRLSHADYMDRGGAEAVEMIMWLAMRGALEAGRAGRALRRVQRSYDAPMLTGLGVLALECAAPG